MSADLLGTIVAATRRIIEVREQAVPLSLLRDRVARLGSGATPAGGRLLEALSRADRLNVIAECKRRSPSRGVLRADYHPATIAAGYATAGAAAISVLTEPTFFDGSLEHLSRALGCRCAHPGILSFQYQILEAGNGADAIL